MAPSLGVLTALLGVTWGVRAASDVLSVPSPNNIDFLNALLAGKRVPGKVPYTLQNPQGNLLEFTSPFPIQGLGINDIKPLTDQGETVCCPPGTVLDSRTRSCVFKASDLCPPGFSLDQATKSICIRHDPPCDGNLFLEDGHCVSPDRPGCADPGAKYNEVTHHCEAIVDPTCDSPLEAKGDDCISKDGPTCEPGFVINLQKGQCELIGGPTCGDGLIPYPSEDKDKNPKLICISTTEPLCSDGTKPVHGQCILDKGPVCSDPDYENARGDCVYKKGPCEQGGKFTAFPDNRDPVCRIEAEAECTDGKLEGSYCISNSKPCGDEKDGFELIDDKTCSRSIPSKCPPGTELILALASSRSGQDQPPRAFCCPSGIEGMTIDALDRCSFQIERESCPNGMTRDPRDSSRCIAEPTQVDCGTGTLTPLPDGTVTCEETKDAVCAIGTPDAATGNCNLGKPDCKQYGSDYRYDDKARLCVSELPPKCPPEADTPLINTGDCISKEKSTCPPGYDRSVDQTKCVHREPPICSGKGKYDPNTNRCVANSKAVCITPEGVNDAVIDGTKCVSPSLPACDPNSGTTFDINTKNCVSTKAPDCPEAFRLEMAIGKCVLKAGPTCDHLMKPGEAASNWKFTFDPESGKCISTSPPVCPEKSTWSYTANGCVSDSKPCSQGGTPDSNGRCLSDEPPNCNHVPRTNFEPGVGCVSDDVVPDCRLPPDFANPRGIPVTMRLDPGTRKCIADQGPSCGGNPDLEVVGQHCVSKTQKPHCPSPTERDEETGLCVASTPPQCDVGKGLRFDDVSAKCVAEPTCKGAATLDEGLGKCVMASERTCFVLLSCPDVVDDTVLGIDQGGDLPGAGRPRIQ